MTKESKSGVKPPLIGKFTGRVRTPLSIFSAFFALGVLSDLIMEALTKVFKPLAGRIHVGFQFWALLDRFDWTMPDGTVVDGRETIAYDDLILMLITVALLFVYKIRMKWRLIAAGGFFTGWYVSSMWISPRVPWHVVEKASETLSSETSSTSEDADSGSPVEQA